MKGDSEMKKIITTVLLFSMLCSIMPSSRVQATKKEEAYQAFYHWLETDAPPYCQEYQLVKIDGDDVPELVGYYKSKRQKRYYYIICSYDGKNLRAYQFCEGFKSASPISYIQGKGKMLFSNHPLEGDSDSGYDLLVTLKKGKFTDDYVGRIEVGSKGKLQYEWKKKKVSEQVYEKNLKKVFDQSKAQAFSKLKYISKSKMKKKLK